MSSLILVVDLLVRVLSLVIIIYVFLSYFMSPFHPIRMTIGRFIEPLLTPIRRLIPTTGTIDFSPFILLVLIQVIGLIVKAMLRSLV